MVSDLPFKFLHKTIIVHLVYCAVLWMNAGPAETGISEHYSPREIVTQIKMNYKKMCCAAFGDYIEASEDAIITNTMRPQTHPCIALGPSNNLQGSVKCIDLETGRVVTRRNFEILPMPDRII